MEWLASHLFSLILQLGTSMFIGAYCEGFLPLIISYDFTISFWLKTTFNPGPTYSQWWAGTGLVDFEVPGVAIDGGISLLNWGVVGFGIGETSLRAFSSV